MNEKDIKNIKKLAKKSLKKKWYPLKKGKKDIYKGGSCAFCEDLESKRETIKRRAGEEYCSICYINLLIPGFCINITHRNISSVIEILEQLANYGVLK